jgi:DNA-directed RNA polymerase specialized sigma24 family protein
VTCPVCNERPIRYTATSECGTCYLRRHRRENPAVAQRDREVSQRWKDANREANRARDRRRIADPERRGRCVSCAGLMGHHVFTDGTCAECVSRRHEERCQQVERMWAEGATLREIAAALGTTIGAVGVQIHRMRAEGRDLPFRRRRKATA